MEKNFWLQMPDQTDIYIKKWYNPLTEPKMIVQIAHGMVEHIQRYDDFAKFLVDHHIFVYGNDHRGHGKTGENQGMLGYMSDQDGFNKATNDLYAISKKIKADYPQTPIVLFGHSMGSFLVRKYIQDYSDFIQGAILSGTGFFPTMSTKVGKFIASKLPPKKQSVLMNSIAFGTYNKKISNSRTSFDWLSRSEQAVREYIDDPLTGYVPTGRFFYDLMDGLLQIHQKKLNQSIRQNLPILFMSGDADPVGNYSKGVWKVASEYADLGLNNIKVMLYTEGRHELLNEINRQEVFEDVYQWILKLAK